MRSDDTAAVRLLGLPIPLDVVVTVPEARRGETVASFTMGLSPKKRT